MRETLLERWLYDNIFESPWWPYIIVAAIFALLVPRGNNPPRPFMSSALIPLARGVMDLTKPSLRRKSNGGDEAGALGLDGNSSSPALSNISRPLSR